MKKIKFILPDFSKVKIYDDGSGDGDPYIYYQKPFVKWFYINRIQYGLDLIPNNRKYDKILEIGYGSGLLMPTLCSMSENVYGIDVNPLKEEYNALISDIKIRPNLIKGNIESTDFKDETFDLIVAFSIFEHLKNVEPALKEVSRILKPGGYFLLGIPRVDRIMEKLFHLIGFHIINQFHFSTYKDVLKKSKPYLKVEKLNYFPVKFLKSGSLYYNILFTK